MPFFPPAISQAALAAYLKLSGGTMLGDLNIAGNRIVTGASAPYGSISTDGGGGLLLLWNGPRTNAGLTIGNNGVVTTQNNTLDNAGNASVFGSLVAGQFVTNGLIAFGSGNNLPYIQKDGFGGIQIMNGTGSSILNLQSAGSVSTGFNTLDDGSGRAGFFGSVDMNGQPIFVNGPNQNSAIQDDGSLGINFIDGSGNVMGWNGDNGGLLLNGANLLCNGINATGIVLGGNLNISSNELSCGTSLTLYASGQGIGFSGESLSGISNISASSFTAISSFIGNGASITALNGSNIASGTVANARTTAVTTATATTIALRDSNGNLTANGYSATQQTLTPGASITWNVASGANAVVTLNANSTIANATNLVAGTYYAVLVKQPASGGPWTLAYGTAYKFPNSVKPILSTAASAIDLLTFYSDGTSLYGVAQKAFG